MRPHTQSTNFDLRSRQSGQGTIEFILLLVVSVALILALSTKIYKPIGEFTKSYMGDYLGCLLDRGILPKLGTEEDLCSEALRLSANNPLAPRSGGKLEKQVNDQKSTKSDKKSLLSQDQQDNLGSRSGQGARSIGQTRERNFSPTSRGSDAANGAGTKTVEVTDPLGRGKFYKTSSSGMTYSEGGQKITKIEGLNGLIMAEKEKIKKKEGRISKVAAVESEESLGKPKVLHLKPVERKIAQEQIDEPWSFGRLIRFAIIAIILIAIVLFLSGQALQISKSWEK